MNQVIAKTSDYAYQVNGHLFSAFYLLNLIDTLPSVPNSWQKRALCESVSLQIYFALRAYLNEITSYYSEHRLSKEQVLLSNFFDDPSGEIGKVTEFIELKQFLSSSVRPWQHLCDLPIWSDKMQQQKETPIPSSPRTKDKNTAVALIHVEEYYEEDQLIDPEALRSMIKELVELIERQRDNQLEF